MTDVRTEWIRPEIAALFDQTRPPAGQELEAAQ